MATTKSKSSVDAPNAKATKRAAAAKASRSKGTQSKKAPAKSAASKKAARRSTATAASEPTAEELLSAKVRTSHASTLGEGPQKPPVKRRRGRPRSDAKGGTDQAREILDVAVRLFTTNGYQATTMSQIAEEAGYNQSSLYYWYKGKEDLLSAIIADTGASLRVATDIALLPDDKLTQLYAVLYADVLMMCSLPCDFYDLETVAQSQTVALREFFTTYQQLTDAIERIIQDGVENGEFIRVDPAHAAVDALALNEGLQHRFRSKMRAQESYTRMIEPSALPLFRDKESVAKHAATTTVKRLAPDCVPADVHRQAHDNNWI